MILISHRGNLAGPKSCKENHPYSIDNVLEKMYQCEIDLRFIEGEFYLGHDFPEYKIDNSWIFDRRNLLWIHCKDISSFEYFMKYDYSSIYNFFYHNDEALVFTSNGYVITHPSIKPIKNSVAMLPEIYDNEIAGCIGVCSDYIQNYI